jgi:hypothetical protein
MLLAARIAWAGAVEWAEAPRTFGAFQPNPLLVAALLWIGPLAWRPRARPVVTAAAGALLVVVIGLYLARGVGLRARLEADRGTLAALRSAIAIYYGAHGGGPAHPEQRVRGFALQCPGFAYAYDQASGAVRVTSTNTTDDCF